ncbi:MAG: glutamate ligase domain-containing protein, partial [Spirochaeta sp.]
EQIFQRRCTETGAPLHRLADNAAVNFDTGHIRFTDGCRIHPAMQVLGSIQLENAALAACVVRGIIPDAEIEAISEGLSATRMLGRMQLIPGVPPIVIDGAHTVDSIKRYLSAIRTVMPAGGTVIFGAVQGKNIPGMVEELTSVFSRAIVCRPGSFKPSNPEAIAAEFRRILPPESVTIVEDATAALEQAAEWTTDPGQGICIAGSFFLAGKILRAIQGIEATAEAV